MGIDRQHDSRPLSSGGIRPGPLVKCSLGILACLGVGWVLLGPLVRLYTVYQPTRCTVLDIRLRSVDDTFEMTEGGSSRRSGGSSSKGTKIVYHYTRFAPLVSFGYSVGGREYVCRDQDLLRGAPGCRPAKLEAERASTVAGSGDKASPAEASDLLRRWLAIPAAFDGARADGLIRRFAPGASVDGWYDPASPEQAVLVRRIEWFHWLVAALLALGIVSCLGDLYRSALRVHSVPPRFPAVLGPRGSRRPTQSRFKGFVFVLGLGLFIGIFIYWAWFLWLIGSFHFWITLIVTPFALLLAVCVFSLLYELTVLGQGAVRVELERSELQPGERVGVRLLQHGPIALRALSLHLVAEQTVRVASRVDSSKKTTKTVVRHSEVLHESGPVRLGASACLDKQLDAWIRDLDDGPACTWKLVVRRRGRLLPILSEEFRLKVVDPRIAAREAAEDAEEDEEPES